jgi:hypothetical protein
VRQHDLDDGEEAKNILCAYFKAGQCDKGDDCEFSHDVNIEFNQGAFDIYTDLRDVKKTHGVEYEVNKIAEEKEKKRSKAIQSNIVCKFFLDAVQKKVYGWKWECPNGDDCHYKHCLPKGYVIVTSKDKMQEEMTMEEYMDLEEQIDEERNRIGKVGTRVNDTTFLEWKKRRDEFRRQGKEHEEKKRKLQTGIQLFRNQSNLFKDDENADDDLEREDINDINQESNDKMINGHDGENGKEDNFKGKTEDEILNELESELKGIKINADLFKENENLDELDDIIDEEEKNDENENDS